MYRPGRENGLPRHERNRYWCVIFWDLRTHDNLSAIIAHGRLLSYPLTQESNHSKFFRNYPILPYYYDEHMNIFRLSASEEKRIVPLISIRTLHLNKTVIVNVFI